MNWKKLLLIFYYVLFVYHQNKDYFFKRKTCEIEREEINEKIIILTSEHETFFVNLRIEERHDFEIL